MADPLSRRQFLQRTAFGAASLGALALGGEEAAAESTDSAGASSTGAAGRASRHPVLRDRPSGNFMDGAILGNGEMGAVVTPLPDAVMIYFGHNAAWDQRMAPLDVKGLGTFSEALRRIEAIPSTLKNLNDDPWFAAYENLGKASYHKKYPRPVPCGAVALRIDRRVTEVLGHRLSIDRGWCEVNLLSGGRPFRLELFAEMSANRVWARAVDGEGRPAALPFIHLAVIPDSVIPAEFPAFEHGIDHAAGAVAYRQTLPYEEVTKPGEYRPHPKDRMFRVSARINRPLNPAGAVPRGIRIGAAISPRDTPFFAVVEFATGLADARPLDAANPAEPEAAGFESAAAAVAAAWKSFWEPSSVALADELLERTWYRNMYFLRCAVSPTTVAPGMYAICQAPNQDLVWHSDYHFDYNTEQAFWSTLSSNHPELNLPYVELVHHVLPVAKEWARDYYGMRGACMPISAYPVELRTYPYGAPVFNWMMGVSAWAIQGVWWHYLYTGDDAFLRERGFEPIQSVAQFLIDYIRRPDVAERPWGDNLYHVFPTFPPELYDLLPGLPKEFNADSIVDLTLIRFVFLAYAKASRILGREAEDAADLRHMEEILSWFPAYPKAKSKWGTVFVSVSGESTEKVLNVPTTLMTVFPGEHHGLHSPPEEYAIAANTYRNQQNEGGNDLVFLNLQGARLGLLDLEKFKREIRYTLMPNGTCTDLNLQIGGRFGPNPRQYDWMASYGIWFENFALPAVINECLMQGYNGELRLFPNWPTDKEAEFHSLRAVGAFLVSAKCAAGNAQWAEIRSEKGGSVTVVSPWKEGTVCEKNGERTTEAGSRFTLQTSPGDRIRLSPA